MSVLGNPCSPIDTVVLELLILVVHIRNAFAARQLIPILNTLKFQFLGKKVMSKSNKTMTVINPNHTPEHYYSYLATTANTGALEIQ